MRILRLKSMELNGYKSFATRTVFEFNSPVTVIVGPNGSGKSNIADGLRWALGEQSYGLLRGRKTEDMIFSGSESKPRGGMASVTITFDNSEGWLPIDFSEVAVTRRAYRDGQNEYLINNQKVRLRDITELLAASALAERTYTVIGQGLVDAALALKSDERRRLFEEAAGIGLYRDRKEQSLNRLEATRHNLERAEDILGELRPRLRTLQKQAERAEEFGQLLSNLRATLREWYGYHWHQAQAELRTLRQEAELREQTLAETRRKQMDLSQNLNGLRDRNQELRLQLSDWQRRLAELSSAREGATRDFAVAGERERALIERKQALAEERNRLEAELAAFRTRLEEAGQDANRYETEVSEAEGRLGEVRQELEAKQALAQERESKTQSLRQRLLQFQTELANTAAQLEILESNMESKRVERAELDRTIELGERGLKEQIARKADLEASVNRAESHLKDMQIKASKLQADVEAMHDKHSKLETEGTQLLALQARLAAEIKGFEEVEAAAAGFAEGARLLQQAAKEGRLRIGKSTLGRELQVPVEYEPAISAALGAYADAVLMDSDDPETALRWLEGRDASATLLPLGSLSPDGRLPASKGEGLVGLAADLIEASPELQPAVDLLLGRVLVVEDRKAAHRMLQTYPNANQVVTLRGEAFHREGQIEVRHPKASGGLSRPRQERSLRHQLEQAQQEEAAKAKELTDLDGQLESTQAAHQAAAQVLEKARIDLETTRYDLQTILAEEAKVTNQLDWFRIQQRTLEGEKAKSETQINDIDEKSKNLKTQLARAESELKSHLENVMQEPMDEPRTQVAHWEMRLAVGQRALQETRRRVSERQQAIGRAEAQAAAQQERAKELEEQLGAIALEKTGLDKRGSSVGVEIEDLQNKIAPAEAELVVSENRLTELQKKEAQALQALSATERGHTQAQIALARQQESLEALRGRIEDDFGLVAFQYDDDVSGPNPLPLGELVEKLPVVKTLSPDLEETLKQQRNQIRRLGSVNPEAQREYVEVKARVENMEEQVKDLRAAEEDLKQVIAEMDLLMDKEFQNTFEQVAAEFRTIFGRLFKGGSAHLLLTEGEDLAATGIDIEARLPGKRAQRLALLSGGERSLTAAALIFALLKASPTPFCVMDEVDAMLDEANVARFTEVLRELSQDTQFVVITHNRNTVQAADIIYGVTMGRDTTSQVISLRLDQVDERYSE